MANKLIFRKNSKVVFNPYTFRDFIGLKKLVYDEEIDLYNRNQFEISNLPNLEEINLPNLQINDINKATFNNLPKLKKILVKKLHYSKEVSSDNYPPIFQNLPNLEDVYVDEIYKYTSWPQQGGPLAVNINSNAVLHFNTKNWPYYDVMKKYYFEYYFNHYGFKTIVF